MSMMVTEAPAPSTDSMWSANSSMVVSGATSFMPSGLPVSAITTSWFAPRNFSFSLAYATLYGWSGNSSAAPGVMSPTLRRQPKNGQMR